MAFAFGHDVAGGAGARRGVVIDVAASEEPAIAAARPIDGHAQTLSLLPAKRSGTSTKPPS